MGAAWEAEVVGVAELGERTDMVDPQAGERHSRWALPPFVRRLFGDSHRALRSLHIDAEAASRLEGESMPA